ncbi:MAG: hypothetical protein ACMUIL_03725 [bacterium]
MKERRGWCITLLTLFVVVMPIALNHTLAGTNRDGNGNNACGSTINLPWQEFKEFLKLDRDAIELTMEELHRLLQQTDPEYKPEYQLTEGRVILSRDEFRKILEHMKPVQPDTMTPIRDYILTAAIYTGRMREGDFAFTADFELTVLKENAYIKVPIISSSLALKGMTINDRPAIVLGEGGFHSLLIDRPGKYRVRAHFSIKSSLDKGPHKLLFPIQEVPITLVSLEIPITDIEVEMPSAQYLETERLGSGTTVKAILAAGRSFDLQWKRETKSEERVPAKIYAESYQLISVEDDALKVNQDVFYNVLQSGVDHLRLAISEGMTILSVAGPGVGDWHETQEGDQRILWIPLDFEQKGTFTVTILSEGSFGDDMGMVEYSGLEVLDTVNGVGDKGYIGIELKTSAELVIEESSGLEKVMVKKLARHLFQKSTNPIILGFRYLKHPYHLALNIKKHEKVALPQATIDSASAVSFFTEDGLVISKIEYAVKNQLKQSLQLTMPGGVHIWSALVGDESVEVGRDGDTIHVPLISSRKHDNDLESFRVEIIYYTESDAFSFQGKRTVALPQADLTVSQLLWSVYLPERFIYYRFITDLEKEDMASGLTPILKRGQIKVDMSKVAPYGWRRPGHESDMMHAYERQRAKTTFRNIDINSSTMSRQVMNEFAFDERLQQIEDKMIQGEARVYGGVGVLPMNIQIPTSGQLYRFASNIVRDEPLELEIRYVRAGLYRAVAWLGILILIIALLIWRRSVASLFITVAGRVKRMITPALLRLRRFFLSRWSLPLLGLLFLFSLSLGVWEAVVCFLLLWIPGMVHLDKRIRRSKSSTKPASFIICLLALSGLLFLMRVPCACSENDGRQPAPQVSLGWEEFKGQIDLDSDDITLTWDEFQKILHQTSKGVKPVYTIQDGKVRLSREQFDNLLDRMIVPAKEIPAPLDHRLTKAVYKGRMTGDWTMIEADLDLEVLEEKGYTRIPFLPSQLGLQEVLVDQATALLITEGGYHQLILDRAGHFRIRAVCSMRSSLDEGNYQVSIPVLETSITMLELEIPLDEITVKVPQAQQVTVSAGERSTLVSAIFPSVKELTVQWYGKKAVPAVRRVPAKIYAQSYHLVSIDDDALTVAMDIEYTILHAGIDALALRIPEGLNILSVQGEGVGGWRERSQEDQRILEVGLDYEHKGVFRLAIRYEKTLLDAASRFSFSTPETLNAVKDIGYLGLELRSSAEVKVVSHEGLEKVAVQKLPLQLFRKSLKPLIFGFKYLDHPFALDLDIRRHPKVSVTMAVIDSANGVSFFTEDGKVVHRIIYEVRNQLKQFLKLQLPEESELWSVFVGDKPSEPAREGDTLYIPLIRSQEEGQRLKPFRVEIIYYQKGMPFSAYGKREVLLPQVTEIMVSKILWSLYLPRDYDFLHFGGTMEKERLAKGIGPLMGCSCAKRTHRLVAPLRDATLESPMESVYEGAPATIGRDKDAWREQEEKTDAFMKSMISREDMARQQVMERGFAGKKAETATPQPQKPQGTGGITSGYDTAVMSIPVSIPLSGQLYRFAKTMARQEPLTITMVYSRGEITDLIAWVLLLIVIATAFFLRRRIYPLGGRIQRASEYMESGLSKMNSMVRRSCDATLTPLILIGLMIAALFTSHVILTSLILLAGLAALIHQRAYWMPEKKEKKKERSLEQGRQQALQPPQETARPRKGRWLRMTAWGLGPVMLILGLLFSVLASRTGRPHYGIILVTFLSIIVYYGVLFVCWLVRRILSRMKDTA